MFRKTKQFLKDNEGAIMFAGGVVIGSAVVIAYPKLFMNVTEEFYNAAQPIPDLLLTEKQIKWEIISGTIASDYLKDKDLMGEFTEFAGKSIKKALDLREQTQ